MQAANFLLACAAKKRERRALCRPTNRQLDDVDLFFLYFYFFLNGQAKKAVARLVRFFLLTLSCPTQRQAPPPLSPALRSCCASRRGRIAAAQCATLRPPIWPVHKEQRDIVKKNTKGVARWSLREKKEKWGKAFILKKAEMNEASRKRPVAHTAGEFRTLVSALAARPSKRHRHAGRRVLHAYATPCDDTDVFDTLPLEMVREVLMRVECWRDVVAFQATARRFANVLAPCDTWTRKYAPETPHDLTVSVRARADAVDSERAVDGTDPCDEPIEAFVAVYGRWGMATKGFDAGGLCRLAAAGRTDALLWLDARVCRPLNDLSAATLDDIAGNTLDGPAAFRCRVKYAREAAAAGQSATLAAVLAAHPDLAEEGEKIMRSAIESDCAAIVDVVHDFARSCAWQCHAHRWCRDVFVTVPPTSPLASSEAPLSVLTYLKAAGCPAAPKPTPFAMGMAISAGLLRVAAWLDALPEVQARPHQLGRCSRRDIDRAAANGHYGVVRWVHERGIRRCALSTLLAGIRSGRHQGRADFVRWALGKEEHPLWPHEKDPAEAHHAGTDRANMAPIVDTWTSRPPAARERPPPARVPEWRDGLLAIEAAKVGALDVVRWLYETHPEMVTPEAARAAASTCNADVAIYLHEVGVAPLAAYPCLRRASEQVPQGERRSRQSVDRVADALDKLAAAGAPYDAQVLANVVRHQCAPALRVIVERYCVGSADAADPVSRRGSCPSASSLLPSSSSSSPTSQLSSPWFVRERRPPPSPWPTPTDIMRAAVEADRLDMIRWVRDNVKGARLCVGVAAMRAAGRKANRIAALGRCRCAECKGTMKK